MNPPCKDCPKKGCGRYHDECPEFQEFRRSREEVYKERSLHNSKNTPVRAKKRYMWR